MHHQLLRKHMDKGVLLVINTLIVGAQHAPWKAPWESEDSKNSNSIPCEILEIVC